MTGLRLATVAALLASLLACALYPYWLTDGDSCLYAAIGRDMADDPQSSWWVPQWAYEGRVTEFYEHPPGSFWLTAAVMKLGFSDRAAPLIANALWLWLLVFAVWGLASRPRDAAAESATTDRLQGPVQESRAKSLGAIAAAVLLLHYPMLTYVVRAGLEVPFAACTVACLYAARLPRRWATPGVGLALAGALLVRGVFALPLPFLLGLDACLHRRERGPRVWRVFLEGVGLGLLLAMLFDLLHQSETGRSFWWAYLEKQVFPSLEAEGTPHPNRDSTLAYYSGRLLLYTLPWSLLAGLAWWRSKERGTRAARKDLFLAFAWILLFFVGIVAARRQGSRYLFAVYPAVAWITAIACRPWWTQWSAKRRLGFAVGTLALVPVLTLGRLALAPEDAWRSDAIALRQARSELSADPSDMRVVGPFAPHDDRWKQFIRYHLGVWAVAGNPKSGTQDLLFASPETSSGRPIFLAGKGLRLYAAQ